MDNSSLDSLQEQSIELLKELISTPSFSKEENDTAELICDFFDARSIPFSRIGNNVYAKNKFYDPAKQSILLNSHHDTVKPNKAYTNDPFQPIIKDGKIFGLGSNDAGGCLVSLIATFIYFYAAENLNHNIVFAASAEEEISGVNGIELVLPYLGQIDFGIVGEPTKLEMLFIKRSRISSGSGIINLPK
jgi:acetylornithine deacetylase